MGGGGGSDLDLKECTGFLLSLNKVGILISGGRGGVGAVQQQVKAEITVVARQQTGQNSTVRALNVTNFYGAF